MGGTLQMSPLYGAWRQTLRIAAAFWATCLVLAALEVTIGSNPVSGILFFLSIPVLVGYLTWANKGLVAGTRRLLLSVVMLGACVLLSATVIILVGLLAAVNLKVLMTGA